MELKYLRGETHNYFTVSANCSARCIDLMHRTQHLKSDGNFIYWLELELCIRRCPVIWQIRYDVCEVKSSRYLQVDQL